VSAVRDYEREFEAAAAEVKQRQTEREKAQGEVGSNDGKADGSPDARRTTFTADELWDMEFPPVQWIVPDYLTPGLTLLVGAPKLGKSWLALDICNAVAQGGYTLGDRHCQPGAVLYAALEDNPRRLKDRLHKVCGRKPGKGFSVWTDMRMIDDGGLDDLRRWIEAADNPRLIVIDVLNKVRTAQGRSEAPYAYDYRSVTPLKDLADEFGLAIVVIHHTRKADAGDKLEKVSGTNGLTGAADTTIILDRDGEGVTLSGRGRDIAEFETALEFQKDNCRWRVLGDAVEVRRSDQRKAILEVLKAAKDPMSSRDIADVTDQTEGNVRGLLAKMAKTGEVEKPKRGLYLYPRNVDNNGNKQGSG
jgi:RecA-family ATPase